MSQPTVLLYVVNPDLEEDQKAWIKEMDPSAVLQGVSSIDEAISVVKSENSHIRLVCISEFPGMDPVGVLLGKRLRKQAQYGGPIIYVGTEEDLMYAERSKLFDRVLPDFVGKEMFQDAARQYLKNGNGS